MFIKGDEMMLPLLIFIVLCFILVYLIQILSQLKEMMRTKQLTELNQVLDDYEEKE